MGSGEVWGKICAPETGDYPLSLYFRDTSTLELHSFEILQGHESFKFELPAGIYIAFALNADRAVGGGFTMFITCGMGEKCMDHNLVPFLVQENRVATGIDICDWTLDTADFTEVPEQ